MKKYVFFICAICVSLISFSQQKTKTQFSGIITDAKTGQPLSGASVLLVESRKGIVTDSAGRFIFNNPPSGHNLVEISYQGYRSIVEHLDFNGAMVKNYKLFSSVIENEAITITAVGGPISIKKTPIPVTRVSRDQLLNIASTNIIDALSRQPGVSQITTGPAISKPVIRGLGYNRLVVINDGIRQEGQQWGDEHGIEIDDNSVNRVEIVKGPASLIYGSDAMAGVINIITTTPAPEGIIRGNLMTSYGTNNRQRSFFGNIVGHQKGINWGLWGDYKAASDYTNKYDQRVWNSKFNEMNFGGSAGYSGNWGYTNFIFSQFNQKLGVVEGDRASDGSFIKLFPGGIEGSPTNDDFNSTDPFVPYQHVRHHKFILDNSFQIGQGRLALTLGYQRNQRQEFGNADDPDEYGLFFDLHTVNYNIAYHLKEKNGWHTSVGANGMIQNNKNRGPEVLIPEYGLFEVGTFIYTQKTVGKASFSGGLRYDFRNLDSKEFIEGNQLKFDAFTRKFSNISGSLGLSYSATEHTIFKVNLARGFRAPSIPELASNGEHEGTNRYEFGNPNLQSETSLQADLGFELNEEHFQFTASAFYNNINNFIYYSKLSGAAGGDSLVNGTPAFQFRQRDAMLYGIEALLDIHPHPLDWLHWQNTFSYVRGLFKEAIDGTRNVPYIPAVRLTSQLRADLFGSEKSKGKVSAFMELDFTFDQNRPFTAFDTETPTPGFTILNAGITADIKRKNKTLFSFFLLGNNLTDVAFQNHLSRLKYTAENPVTGRIGVFNMGRNLMIKLNVPLRISK
jgi:iron complex outermembrane receptor protein